MCEYTLTVNDAITPILFTRDPATGIVQKHTSPYPNLPRFRLSANPWMVSAHAYGSAIYQQLPSPLVRRVGASIESGTLPAEFRPDWKPTVPPRRYDCPSLTYGSLVSDAALTSLSGESVSEDDYEFSELAVKDWITSLPPLDAFSDMDTDEHGDTQLYALEQLPEPKTPSSVDDTNWRSVASRRQLLDLSTFAENVECLPEYTNSPSGSQYVETGAPPHGHPQRSEPRRPHSADGVLLGLQGEGSGARRSCPPRQAKTVAAAALVNQLCAKSKPPRSSHSSKRKRVVQAPALESTDARPCTEGGAPPRRKRARLDARETRSLPSRVAKTVAADRMTKQLWARGRPAPTRRC